MQTEAIPDWVKDLPEVAKRPTSRRQYERFNFVGETLEHTLLVRAGFDGASTEGVKFSICPRCGFMTFGVPLHGSFCEHCNAEANEDARRVAGQSVFGGPVLTNAYRYGVRVSA